MNILSGAVTALIVATVLCPSRMSAQERKKVPSDSVRVFVAGCSRGSAMTAGRSVEDQPGGNVVPEGTRLRMTGPKKILKEIKAREGTRVEITGLIRKGQIQPGGVRVGGVRIGAGAPGGGGALIGYSADQVIIDVEGWRTVPGDCPSR